MTRRPNYTRSSGRRPGTHCASTISRHRQWVPDQVRDFEGVSCWCSARRRPNAKRSSEHPPSHHPREFRAETRNLLFLNHPLPPPMGPGSGPGLRGVVLLVHGASSSKRKAELRTSAFPTPPGVPGEDPEPIVPQPSAATANRSRIRSGTSRSCFAGAYRAVLRTQSGVTDIRLPNTPRSSGRRPGTHCASTIRCHRQWAPDQVRDFEGVSCWCAPRRRPNAKRSSEHPPSQHPPEFRAETRNPLCLSDPLRPPMDPGSGPGFRVVA